VGEGRGEQGAGGRSEEGGKMGAGTVGWGGGGGRYGPGGLRVGGGMREELRKVRELEGVWGGGGWSRRKEG